MKLCHKNVAIFKFPKFHLYMDVSIVELACDNQFLKLSDEHGHKLLDKMLLWAFKPYKLYILTSQLC